MVGAEALKNWGPEALNKLGGPIFTSSTGMPVRESIFVQTNIGASESPFHGNHKLMQAASIKSTYQMLRAAPNANKDMYTAGYETMESMSKLVDKMRKSSIAVEKDINGMMMDADALNKLGGALNKLGGGPKQIGGRRP